MAKISLDKQQSVFSEKTIQPNNWFVIRFPPEFDGYMGFHEWMAVDVNVQEPVEFQKVGFQVQGRPFSRPVLKENDGYEFTITMEETSDWKVMRLINQLERRNINEYGIHSYWTKAKIGEIRICALSPEGYVGNNHDISKTWVMVDSFFVRADGMDFSYSSPSKITRKLTFCCNQIKME